VVSKSLALVMPRSAMPDIVGLALLLALGTWVTVSQHVNGGDATNYWLTVAVIISTYVVGRLVATQGALPGAVVATGFFVLTFTGADAFSGGPLAGPLGYSNANAALAVQVAAICAICAFRSELPIVHWSLGGAAVASMALTLVNQSNAAAIGALLVLGSVALAARGTERSVELAMFGLGLLTFFVASMQWLLAYGWRVSPIVEALSQRRIDLWNDAAHLAGQHPLYGTGPQTFALVSPTAAADNDTRATHSVVLEAAAESGFLAAILVLLFALWGFSRLLASGQSAVALIGVAAWAAFALQTIVDYVADFPIVVGAAFLSLGLAVGPFSGSGARGRERYRAPLPSGDPRHRR